MLTKQEIWSFMKAKLDQNISDAMHSIALAKESRNSETKSTAGDKYETGRAMVQIEIDKNAHNLNATRELINELSKIKLEKEHTKVEFGSLVYTDMGVYFISIGMGKLGINGFECFAISLASPLGAMMKDKKIGDKIVIQGRELTISQII